MTDQEIADLALAAAQRGVEELIDAISNDPLLSEDEVFDRLVPDADHRHDRPGFLVRSAALEMFLAAQSAFETDHAEDNPDPNADVGYELVEGGDLRAAFQFADQLTRAADAMSPDDWNYGNLIHHAHVIRGKAHLASGDLDLAATELRAASETPGSPQLDTFGPDFSLAWALLLAGRDDDVLHYLHGVARFWEPDR